jgi:hypothetical protein
VKGHQEKQFIRIVQLIAKFPSESPPNFMGRSGP